MHVYRFGEFSFHDDHLWNLVLACRECNLSKRDWIADRVFLGFLIDHN
nr:HNH endonuclease domain-containing protein [Geobacillus proteiniphilus]